MKNKLVELWELHTETIVTLAKNIVIAAVIVVAGILVFKALHKLINRAAASGLHVDAAVTSLLRMVVRYGIIILCLIMVLNVFGVNTASLIAVLGAAGIAIGLALKDTLGNIAAGIILLFLGSYRRGEYIEFGAYSGTVKDIGLFTTILETPDGIFISAPNSSIWGVPLKNYTRNGKRRMELSVGIAYTDSIDAAFAVMQNIIAQETRFLAEPAPQVLLQSIKESSVIITIRAWASTSFYWDIYWEQMRSLKTKIEAAGLHVPFPQRDVHIVGSREWGVGSRE
jgi:small conductance mechanosensitive channel